MLSNSCFFQLSFVAATSGLKFIVEVFPHLHVVASKVSNIWREKHAAALLSDSLNKNFFFHTLHTKYCRDIQHVDKSIRILWKKLRCRCWHCKIAWVSYFCLEFLCVKAMLFIIKPRAPAFNAAITCNRRQKSQSYFLLPVLFLRCRQVCEFVAHVSFYSALSRKTGRY